ncbi:unnamed protein product [Ilex paraguariensis]|uniref:Uncharacterized protein n=1 Tax=Ilex paraguariensis TaxID=185542 RepID=A0ABC8TV43_9AQUA
MTQLLLPKRTERNDTGQAPDKQSPSSVGIVFTQEGFCSASSMFNLQHLTPILNLSIGKSQTQHFVLLISKPGFTRSVYKRDHALITPESHVFSPLPYWTNTLGAYLISPAMGSHFVMYLAKMQENSKSELSPSDVERCECFSGSVCYAVDILYVAFFMFAWFIFVLQGTLTLNNVSGISHKLVVDSYAYLPLNLEHSFDSDASASLVVFERRSFPSFRYAYLENHNTEQIVGSTDKQPLLETPGEVMDFQPGEFLNVKEVHYNEHGLLLLGGQGVYRPGDSCCIPATGIPFKLVMLFGWRRLYLSGK